MLAQPRAPLHFVIRHLLFVIPVSLAATPALAVPLVPIIGPALSHTGNLVQNGSFEDHPGPPSNYLYWATGTTGVPFLSPASWDTAGPSQNYALWGDLSPTINTPAPVDGAYYLYFGNGGVAFTSQVPTFNPDGTVTYAAPPTITSGYGAPVTLHQKINGLVPNAAYRLSFWITGESEFVPEFNHDGIFALDLTGYDTTYLTVPYNASSVVGPDHVYLFDFTAAASSVDLTFTNWGHYLDPIPNWPYPRSTELILDDVIINQVPEPTTALILAIPSIALLARRKKP